MDVLWVVPYQWSLPTSIYRGRCLCGSDYIGETVRNARLRWNEHEKGTDKNSECAEHLNENDYHEIKWQSIFWLFHNCDSRTHEDALFQNIFKFCTFLPKFSNMLPFFALFLPFF